MLCLISSSQISPKTDDEIKNIEIYFLICSCAFIENSYKKLGCSFLLSACFSPFSKSGGGGGGGLLAKSSEH